MERRKGMKFFRCSSWMYSSLLAGCTGVMGCLGKGLANKPEKYVKESVVKILFLLGNN